MRLVSTVVFVNGRAQSIYDILESPHLSSLLSDEGVISNVFSLVQILMQRKSAPANAASQLDHFGELSGGASPVRFGSSVLQQRNPRW